MNDPSHLGSPPNRKRGGLNEMLSPASVCIALTLAGTAVAFSPAALFPMNQGISSTKQVSSLISSRSLPLRKESSISRQVGKSTMFFQSTEYVPTQADRDLIVFRRIFFLSQSSELPCPRLLESNSLRYREILIIYFQYFPDIQVCSLTELRCESELSQPAGTRTPWFVTPLQFSPHSLA